jgi:molybdopterin molybdotransferase
MISIQQALEIILENQQPLGEIIELDLLHCLGYVLAEDIQSQQDFPYWDNSAMDGYALRYEDLEDLDCPITLKVIEEIPAGIIPKNIIKKGEAARIFTGAMLPNGSDTIVMQEQTKRDGQNVLILTKPQSLGAFVRKRGEYYKAHTPLLIAGHRLKTQDIPLLTIAERAQVRVYRRPKIAIFSTGDELKKPGTPLEAGQIVDSNQYALASLVKELGCEPICLGIVPDLPEKTREMIELALKSSDVVLSTGGVSVGEYDYVEETLRQLGGNILINSVAIKPGKPLTVASFSECNKLYFGIPGNPVSTLVVCWRLISPALKKLSGQCEDLLPKIILVSSQSRLTSDGKRETYLCGQLKIIEGKLTFYLSNQNQSSANLIHLAKTNALAILPIGCREIPIGESVMVLILSSFFG